MISSLFITLFMQLRFIFKLEPISIRWDLYLDMNFLAHAHLSFNHSKILTGNLISDFVKGSSQYSFEKAIHNGIVLHRKIDSFTDQHESIKKMKQVFKSEYGLYAGVFADVVLDYFLANDENEFKNDDSLFSFSQTTYQQLSMDYEIMPIHFQKVFLNMKEHNWLYHYKNLWAIQKSFESIVRRAKFLNESETAFKIFEENIELMRPYYDDFFPEIKSYSASILAELLNDD